MPFTCNCNSNNYVHPSLKDIPVQLQALEHKHILALRPFDIYCGKYNKLQYSYRKKSAVVKFICSKLSVIEKINNLDNDFDKQLYLTAYTYLMSTPDSSYSHYIHLRNSIICSGKQPSIFDIFNWEGVECALWPNFYPFTSLCESIHDGSSNRKSSKVSFLTRYVSTIADYSLNFELLHFV